MEEFSWYIWGIHKFICEWITWCTAKRGKCWNFHSWVRSFNLRFVSILYSNESSVLNLHSTFLAIFVVWLEHIWRYLVVFGNIVTWFIISSLFCIDLIPYGWEFVLIVILVEAVQKWNLLVVWIAWREVGCSAQSISFCSCWWFMWSLSKSKSLEIFSNFLNAFFLLCSSS